MVNVAVSIYEKDGRKERMMILGRWSVRISYCVSQVFVVISCSTGFVRVLLGVDEVVSNGIDFVAADFVDFLDENLHCFSWLF